MTSVAGEVRLAPLEEAAQALGGVLAAHDAGQQRVGLGNTIWVGNLRLSAAVWDCKAAT